MKILSLKLLAIALLFTNCGKEIENNSKTGHFKTSQNNKKSYNPSKNLLNAVKGQSRVLVMQALAEKANPNLVTNDGIHLLNLAIETGNIEIVSKLIENGADVNASNLINTDYALLIAIKNNHHQIAKLLIRKGAQVNFNNRPSPLKYAIEAKMKDVVELLIFKNAELEWNKKFGQNAYELSKTYLPEIIPLLETAQFTSSKGLDLDYLLKVINEGDTLSLSFIATHARERIKSLAPSNSLIAQAISHEEQELRFEMVKTLLKSGLSPDGEMDDKFVPLIIAIKKDDYNIAELLIQNGANVNKTNDVGRSALLVASKMLAIKNVELLLNNGAQTEYTTVINDRRYRFKVCRFVPNKRYFLRSELRELPAEEIEELYNNLMEVLACK